MNIYSLLKFNRFLKSTFLKSIGIWLLQVLHKRYLVVFFDPILACNFRCRMCYFSSEDRRQKLKGSFKSEDLNRIAEVIFPQALKLQIGCGAEPTIFKHNVDIVRVAKQYGVPYISFTTNANLLVEDEIHNLLEAGLNEFTISLHGVEQETYEYMMKGGSYDIFMNVLRVISKKKLEFPHCKIRVNYTANDQNVEELSRFFKVFEDISIDILQVRPIQDIGGEIKSIQNKVAFNQKFNEIITTLRLECQNKKIMLIAPSSLSEKPKVNRSSAIMDAVYCYISPTTFWHDDLDWRNETFRQYSKRVNYSSKMFRSIFSKKQLTNNKLNYEID